MMRGMKFMLDGPEGVAASSFRRSWARCSDIQQKPRMTF